MSRQDEGSLTQELKDSHGGVANNGHEGDP